MDSKSVSAATAAMVHQRQLLEENVKIIQAEEPGAHPVLQALVCDGIASYNLFAAAQHWPVFPLPSFCAPAPPPTP